MVRAPLKAWVLTEYHLGREVLHSPALSSAQLPDEDLVDRNAFSAHLHPQADLECPGLGKDRKSISEYCLA